MTAVTYFFRALFLATAITTVAAAQTAAATGSPSTDLEPIANRISAALQSGQPVNPADGAALDALLHKYADNKSEAVAQIAMTKAANVLRA